jgi:hypothetical protein
MDTDKLISLVRQRKGLWDREHPEHRSLYTICKLWEEVAKELNSTSDKVKTKWQLLRHSFSKTQRKMRMRGYGMDDLKMSHYKTLRQLDRLSFLKSQYKSSASSGDIPSKENKTSRGNETDTRDEGSGSSQPHFNELYHEKEPTSPHASKTKISPKEKKASRDEQRDSRDRGLETIQQSGFGKELKASVEVPKTRNGDLGLEFCSSSTSQNFKHLCSKKDELTSYASNKDHPPKEKQILRGDQTATQVGRVEIPQLSYSGKKIKPSDKVSKERPGDDGVERSGNSTLPHSKRLCIRRDLFISHFSTTDLLPEEGNIAWHIQVDRTAGESVIAQGSRSGNEHEPSSKLSRRSTENGREKSSRDPSLHLKRLGSRKDQFTSHASTKDLPPKKIKDFRDIQTDIIHGEVKTSQDSGARKKLKTNAEAQTTRTRDPGPDSSGHSTTPQFKCLSFMKGNFLSNASSGDIPLKENNILRADQTASRNRGSENAQFGGPGKEPKHSAELPKRRSGGDGLELSKSLTSPSLKYCLQKYQLKSHASNSHIQPKENKISWDDKADTRDEQLEGSKIIKFVGAPADILDVETEACGPLSSNEQQAALSIESHTTKHNSRRSYQTDVDNASTQTEGPMLRVSEDEHNARDEDTIFFDSLIPHVKGLSLARKMQLRIKTQKLIYQFVYNEKLQTQQ